MMSQTFSLNTMLLNPKSFLKAFQYDSLHKACSSYSENKSTKHEAISANQSIQIIDPFFTSTINSTRQQNPTHYLHSCRAAW